MGLGDRSDLHLLAGCAGFRLVAEDGAVGVVDTPLFPFAAAAPDFLVARTGNRLRPRRPVVPVTLVTGVDAVERVVAVAGTRSQIAALPEHLPVAG